MREAVESPGSLPAPRRRTGSVVQRVQVQVQRVQVAEAVRSLRPRGMGGSAPCRGVVIWVAAVDANLLTQHENQRYAAAAWR
jgi:hypothetical protein